MWQDNECWDLARRGVCPRGSACRYEHTSSAGHNAQLLVAANHTKPPPCALPLPGMLTGTCGFMRSPTADYATQLRCVELNYTWHDGQKGGSIEIRDYEKKAREMSALGLVAVIKVSGHATHEMRLSYPERWWPWLWEHYRVFARAGVLAALLWQLPPSLPCTNDTLFALQVLARSIKPCGIRHIFEFRHPSWYERPEVADICRQHGFCIAWVHLDNTAGWAGEMPNGWNPADRASTAEFVYHRLFGPDGRNLGKYTDEFLQNDIVQRLPANAKGFVMFSQDSAPLQARENAIRLQEMLDENCNPSSSN